MYRLVKNKIQYTRTNECLKVFQDLKTESFILYSSEGGKFILNVNVKSEQFFAIPKGRRVRKIFYFSKILGKTKINY